VADGLRISLLAAPPGPRQASPIDHIASALFEDPDILLLDEPTAGLDQHAGADLLGVLGTLARGRITVIATRYPSVAALADHQLWLDVPRQVTRGCCEQPTVCTPPIPQVR
jgi:energy-coupling factor transporter ATP-binding protein EcfA2